MRKIIEFFATVIIILLSVAACTEITPSPDDGTGTEEEKRGDDNRDINPDDPSWDSKSPEERVLTEELVFPSTGGTDTIVVAGNCEDWKAGGAWNWIAVRQEGHYAIVTVSPNPTPYQARESYAYIAFNDGTQIKIKVTQTDQEHDVIDPKGPLYVRIIPETDMVEGSELIVSNQYAAPGFRIMTNGESWEANIDQPWAELRVNDIYVAVDLKDNTDSLKRAVRLAVTAKRGTQTASDTVTIWQKGLFTPPVYDGDLDYGIWTSTFYADEKRMSDVRTADVESHTVTFSRDAASRPSQGEVLVMPVVTEDIPEGILGRVTGIEETENGYVCTYTEVPIQEAFEHIDIPELDIDLDNYVQEIRMADGEEVQFVRTRSTSSGSATIQIPEFTIHNLDQTILVSASAELDLGMKFSLQTDRNGLYYFGTVLEPVLSMNMNMEANVQFEALSSSYPLMTVICGAFPVGPVVITPLVEISFIVGADGKVGMKAGIKYKQKAKMKYIWQAPVGSTYDISIEEGESDGNPFSINEGKVFLEGGIYAGFDYSVGLGLYGTLLYGTVGMQESIRCSGTISLDVDRLASEIGGITNGEWWPYGMEFSTDYVTQGIAAIKSFGATLASVKTTDQKENIDKRYPYPFFRGELASLTKESATINIYCTANTLFPAHMGVRVYAQEPGKTEFTLQNTIPAGVFQTIDPKQAVYPSSDPERMYNKFTVEVPLYYEGVKYVVKPYALMYGTYLTNYEDDWDDSWTFYNPSFVSGTTADGNLADVLKDLMKYLRNDDPDAVLKNWGTDTPLNNWQGVTVSKKPDGTIEMYANPNSGNSSGSKWYLTGDVEVGSHTSGQKCQWTFECGGEPNCIVIHDRNCKSFPVLPSVSKLIIESNKFDDLTEIGNFGKLNALESFELDGAFSGIETLNLTSPKLKTVILNGMTALKRVSITDSREFEEITTTGTPLFEAVRFKNTDLSGYSSQYLFKDIETLRWIEFNGCTVPETIRLSNLPALETVQTAQKDGPLPGLEFEKCFTDTEVKLTTAYTYHFGEQFPSNSFYARNMKFTKCGLKSFEISYYSGNTQFCIDSDGMTFADCDNLQKISMGGNDTGYNYELHKEGDEETKLDFEVRKLSITGCTNLSSLSVSGVGLKELDIEGSTQSLKSVNLLYNRMTGVMPSWLIEIKEIIGGTACDFYDHKYKYDYNNSTGIEDSFFEQGHGYKTNPYGFYYSEEPKCGYHYKKGNRNGY